MDLEDLHVLDLPQLHTRPLANELISVLKSLKRQPRSWNSTRQPEARDIKGLEKYLTSIIASPLSWLQEDMQESIWSLASIRLSERAGRSGMSALDRTFAIPTRSATMVDISIHEPALTMDNLGLKTWVSSYILAKRLCNYLPDDLFQDEPRRALELGSGTGLVGMAAAAVWAAEVVVTDLPAIMDNLARNVSANSIILKHHGGEAQPAILDWESPTSFCLLNGQNLVHAKFPVILAADSIYHESHPRLLVQVVKQYLSPKTQSRVLVALPVRPGYGKERDSFRLEMQSIGLELVEEAREAGYDDWGTGGDEGDGQVECWISVWGRGR